LGPMLLMATPPNHQKYGSVSKYARESMPLMLNEHSPPTRNHLLRLKQKEWAKQKSAWPASPPLLEFSPSTPPPTMATPQYAFNEARVQLAGSGIMQESELQASITRTQNDINRVHEAVVRTQDGVVLLSAQPLPPFPFLTESMTSFPPWFDSS